jgi:DNA mismatch repair protein MutL
VPEIRILPENVVNQIAAGEVVERAASVLKELVENSLDAGASRIQIVLKGYGRELIQVVDDGCGMSRNNLLLAFERHATSKLTSPDDLWDIRTLGFRGEALPSIASVSILEARSNTDTGGTGLSLRLEGGTIVHEEPTAHPRGTSLAVHSLFYNTPARAKFLKSVSTELAHLVRVFKHYALAYPGVAWTFSHGESLEYNLPSAPFLVRLDDLFGAGFTQKVLPLDFEAGGIRVTGAIGKIELSKKSRGDQYIFLNRRPIQSPMIHSAVKAALRDQLEQGDWPFYVLLLDVPTVEADVNVHPAKTEVRFSDERKIHAAVYHAVRSVLPSALMEEPPASFSAGSFAPSAWSSPAASGSTAQASLPLPPPRTTADSGGVSPVDAGAAEVLPASPVERPLAADSRFRPTIFQVHEKYLISPIRSGIAIIDQHAAHERILYERALRSFQERMFNSQQLLFPMLLELSPEDDALFQEVRADLADLGFQIRDFGERTYSVEAVPAGLKRVSEAGMIHSMLDEYTEFRRANFAPRDALAASFACRAAVKAGDALTPEEMTALVDELFATKFPLTCPHGRPTVIHVKLSELDRRFKRTE